MKPDISMRPIVMSKKRRTGCLSGNTLEDIVDEGVENGHRLVGDTSVRVDLLEDCASRQFQVLVCKLKCKSGRLTLVDVRGVGLLARLAPLLLLTVCARGRRLGSLLRCLGLGGLSRGLGGGGGGSLASSGSGFGGHCD